ncbi:MAG: YigZ family protein [Butyrivibrio sp.]|jgi:uncharacterized YigZ family protein|nr:YigZ family protein [Butyrivibrio sp.]
MAENTAYRIVTQAGTAQIEEKKSRFIADVFPVKNAEDAEIRIGEVTKKYWDAKHHCYAYIIGSRSELSRCSDNGEPSGTAGKPILEVLAGEQLTDTLVIVTRYFGGVLLGTGGLVRAYTQAAQAGIAVAQKGRMVYAQKLTIRVDYHLVNAVQYYLKQEEIEIEEPRYAEKVEYDITVIEERVSEITAQLIQRTDGQAVIIPGDRGYYEANERN